MSTDGAAPRLDDRDSAALLSALLGRLPGYVPGWAPPPGGPARALLQIDARFLEIVLERLDEAPEKNRLAFLDLLGLSLVEATAARAPVVFQFSPPPPPALPAQAVASNAALGLPPPPAPMALPVLNIRVEAGTRVAANPPGAPAPLVFETERPIVLAGARLAQVVSLWPGRDTFDDHSDDVAAGRPFTLFRSTQITPHALYLAHEGDFALKGQSIVEVAFDLLTSGSQPLVVAWDYFDGQGWHPFGDPDLHPSDNPDAAPPASEPGILDGTDGLSRSGVIRLSGDCVDAEATIVAGVKAHWIRARLDDPLPPDVHRIDALVRQIRVNTVIQRLFSPDGIDSAVDPGTLGPKVGLKPDTALADGTKLDLSKAFYPLGASPQPGSTFAFSSEEVFSKPGAVVRLALPVVVGPQGDPSQIDTTPDVIWEYWDGEAWLGLDVAAAAGTTSPDFTQGGLFAFVVPDQTIPKGKINDQDGRWVRARLASGAYAKLKSITISGTPSQTLTITENHPPMLSDIRLAYVYRSPRVTPERCLAYNDFAYEDHSDDNRWPGSGFVAFRAVADPSPALYLGFDQPLPADRVSLYLEIEEQEGQPPGPPLTWEYWDGLSWSEVAVEDDTARLVRPGMIAFIGPSDAAALSRFDPSLYWVRARLREDGEPVASTVLGVYPNATWALHSQTNRDEVLGSGTGEPDQAFFLLRTPVLDGEVVEVRELDGRRAPVDLPILAREVDPGDLDIVYAPDRTVSEVWVRWQGRPNFYGSGPDDRHYVLERSQGRLVFGDGVNGRLVPAGTDNVRAHLYLSGGGASGNVPAGVITQLLGGLPYVSGVTNPRAAEGGADGETSDEVRDRGPRTIRHRERAVSARDFESLAFEASPGVAVARALTATDPSGRHAVGWVKVIVVPHSQDPRPWPTFGLRRQVQQYLTDRGPAGLAGVFVTGPSYLPVGVSVVVAPTDPDQAGPVGVAVREALEGFLHPLTGGPGGRGWPFGRDVALSDVAAMLEALPGVDYVRDLELLLDGIAQGEQVAVPPDRIVVAGPLRIRLRESQG